MDKITSFRDSRPRYAALRAIGALCTTIGAILIAVGGCLLLWGLHTLANNGWAMAPPNQVPFSDPQSTRASFLLLSGFSLLWSLVILLSGVQLIATGAFLRLMIHLEENTRASAQALDRIRSRLEANPEGVAPLFRT
jgi:hypothetical protein